METIRATDYLAGDKLYRDVTAYARLGDHRTASEIDLKTSAWIADQLEIAGLRTRFLPFSLRQFHLKECFLTLNGKTIESFLFVSWHRLFFSDNRTLQAGAS